eukprot:5478706-Pyramimonas_sp.AAC.2
MQGLVGFIWVAFAVHIYLQFSKPYDSTNHDAGPLSRLSRLCMYDPFVCVIILVIVFSIVWTSMGSKWLDSARDGRCVSASHHYRLMGSLASPTTRFSHLRLLDMGCVQYIVSASPSVSAHPQPETHKIVPTIPAQRLSSFHVSPKPDTHAPSPTPPPMYS